jgi:hypothetical protein
LVVKKQWVPPSSGWVKLNMDGSFHVKAKDGGVPTVLHDDRGAIILAACHFLGAYFSVLKVELLACLEGCRLARQWNNLPCIMESDCLETVTLINSSGEERSTTTHLLKEVKMLLIED